MKTTQQRLLSWLQCLLLIGGGLMAPVLHAKPSSPTPDAYEIVDAAPFYLSSHKGKWVVIHYWSDWCRSCVKEIPTLNKFIQKHPNVVFRGVHLDDPKIDKQLALSRKLNIQFPLIHQIGSSSKFPKPQNIEAIPATLVFSPDSKKIEEWYGPIDLESLEKILALKSKKQ